MLDDLDREKKQKDMLVGSLNAASKYTIGRGKMQKLCGLIITKNIDPDRQKMPAKIVEGRLNWLNMRMDPDYEMEEMETNMENMFDHVNEMTNTDMPRDFLASLSKYFFREEGEKLSGFQKKQMEACLYLEQRRPHWRKRKSNASSQFLSIFYILEDEVMESNDEVAKSLFVEAFNSREAYTENLMAEFDETDKLEKKMSTGHNIKFPGFVYDGDETSLADGGDEGNDPDDNNAGFDFNNFVLEVSTIIENIGNVEQSKYVKLFEKDGEHSIGIHITRIKALSKRNSATLSAIPPNIKMYPKQVKSATKVFTKLTATINTGAANTGAGYCMLINVRDLSMDSKARILHVLGREDLLPVENPVEGGNTVDADVDDDVDDDDGALVASQDYPNFYQSQTSDTLLHCTVCEFMSRNKIEFQQHVALHPTCSKCNKKFLSENNLRQHMNDDHTVEKAKCTLCNDYIVEADMPEHIKAHERFSSFRKGLEATQKSGKGTKNKESKEKPKKKGLNCYLLFAEEHRNQVKAENPGKPALEITKILSQMWQNLPVSEKNMYKEKAKIQVPKKSEKCPKCEQTFESQTHVINHMMSIHMTQTEIASSSSSTTTAISDNNQAIIIDCKKCGKLFFNQERLDMHMRDDHATDTSSCNGGCGGACNGVCMSEELHVDEIANVEETEDAPKEEIVWVKISKIFWPGKILRKLGELTEVQLFDNEQTQQMVQNCKLKPFQELTKVPKNRSKYWKEAYELALLEFDN